MNLFHARTIRARAAAALIAAWLSLSSCCSTPHCDTCGTVQSDAVAVMAQPVPALQVAPIAQAEPMQEAAVKNGDEALQRLMEGNKRFVAFHLKQPNDNAARRASLSNGQQPFATIFSCVDSRVPPELVFDRGLGDLFVTRTAGQVPDRAVLGSIEYGAEHLHIHLLMIMGHKSCGAVKATIDTLAAHGHAEGNIGALIEGITPAVEKAKTAGGELLDKAIRTNVELGVERMKHVPLLEALVKKGELKIVGGVYNLDTGEVELTVP